MVVRPAIVGRDIIPVGDPPELVDKPLLLKLFTFEDNPRLQKTTICGDGFDKGSPSAGLRALEEGLPPGIATANDQGIQAYFFGGLVRFVAKVVNTYQNQPYSLSRIPKYQLTAIGVKELNLAASWRFPTFVSISGWRLMNLANQCTPICLSRPCCLKRAATVART